MTRTFLALMALLLSPCLSAQSLPEDKMSREMRGLWVASVANIDWPSAPGLTDAQLKAEANAILDRARRMGLNAVFLQVRPSSDALYRSKIEPWSFYLVGDNQGAAPSFDPLTYWVDAAHARGLELHAWINPFRVTPKADFHVGWGHVSTLHPEWTIRYAGKLYLDPGIPEARDYVRKVVMDIVSRYDIDGMHFDDYFYPYPVNGEAFADGGSFARNNAGGLTLNDWRRSNVTAVISAVADAIRQSKPWVQFGISPFGVWRNKRDDARGSDTRAGVTDYDVIYADILNWIDEGMVDYVVPQVYWEHGNKFCDFDVLQRWWGERSTDSTQVYIGHAVFKINDGKVPGVGWNSGGEMPSQLQKVRGNKRLGGSVFFSYRQFNRNILGFEDYLANDFYRHPALVRQVGSGAAVDLEISHLERDGRRISWELEGDTALARFFVVYRALRGDADKIGGPESVHCIVDRPYVDLAISPGKRQRYVYRVAAVDKYRVVHGLSRRLTVREGGGRI